MPSSPSLKGTSYIQSTNDNTANTAAAISSSSSSPSAIDENELSPPRFQKRKRCTMTRQRRWQLPRPFLLAVIVLLSFLSHDSRPHHSSSRSSSSPQNRARGIIFPFFADAVTISIQKTNNDPSSDDNTSSPSRRQTKTSPITPQTRPSLNKILVKAGKRGLGGGIPGAIAGVVQVLTLMWLRTVTNFQYRYGTPFFQTMRMLYNEGGIPRFYRGVLFALVQAPLARFGSTAANDGVEALVAQWKFLEDWGPGRWTVLASFVVGLWRVMIMPLDTCKTVLQVDAAEGFRNLMRKVRAGKIAVLYQGSIASAISSIISHYPWFYTYNVLSKNEYVKSIVASPLLRNAGIGFLASVVSDTVSNCIRVVKTTKQAVASKHVVGYGEAISMVLAADGWKGLFGRGLRTRILGNGFQSIVFTVVWRGLASRFRGRDNDDDKTIRDDPEEFIGSDNEDEIMDVSEES